jgi:hypothetical protein
MDTIATSAPNIPDLRKNVAMLGIPDEHSDSFLDTICPRFPTRNSEGLDIYDTTFFDLTFHHEDCCCFRNLFGRCQRFCPHARGPIIDSNQRVLVRQGREYVHRRMYCFEFYWLKGDLTFSYFLVLSGYI